MWMRWLLVSLLALAQAALAEIAPWNENPRYWAQDGKPVLLVGGSDDDNLFQWTEPELSAQLDRLQQAGGNVVRNTMSDRRDKGFEIYPYRQLPSGKYDLDQWNAEYWQRFERFLRETARRGIVVQIELWDRFDFTDHSKIQYWQAHPYNPKNNVNYSYWRSGFAPAYYDHPGQNRQPFFFTTPGQHNNRLILGYQQRFIDKVLEYALQYDHVLYCIDNETSAEEAWSRYWAQYVKSRAAMQGKKVYLTEMMGDKKMSKQVHGRTLDHPEVYDFVEVSQNNHSNGRTHWENLLAFRAHLSGQPRPMNSIKIYGADGNSFGHSDQQALERYWRNLLGGVAVARFHRPKSGLGLNDKAVSAIRAARLLEAAVPLWTLTAAPLKETAEEARFYEARSTEGVRVLYFPAGKVGQGPSVEQGSLRWLNLDRAVWGPQAEVASGNVAPPDDSNWIALWQPSN
jgi:hypothetical protein